MGVGVGVEGWVGGIGGGMCTVGALKMVFLGGWVGGGWGGGGGGEGGGGGGLTPCKRCWDRCISGYLVEAGEVAALVGLS